MHDKPTTTTAEVVERLTGILDMPEWQEGFAAGETSGAADAERRIVEWLRKRSELDGWMMTERVMLTTAAKAIERGEHRG
jgi:hypothetical protein